VFLCFEVSQKILKVRNSEIQSDYFTIFYFTISDSMKREIHLRWRAVGGGIRSAIHHVTVFSSLLPQLTRRFYSSVHGPDRSVVAPPLAPPDGGTRHQRNSRRLRKHPPPRASKRGRGLAAAGRMIDSSARRTPNMRKVVVAQARFTLRENAM
jgi:hypothetical protein